MMLQTFNQNIINFLPKTTVTVITTFIQTYSYLAKLNNPLNYLVHTQLPMVLLHYVGHPSYLWY